MDRTLAWPQRFEDSLARAVDAQRRSVLGTGAAVRLVGAAVFLALTTVLWLAGGEDWEPYPAILGPYVGVVAVLFVVRARPEARWLGAVQSLVDVALVYGLQHVALPISPFPAGVAGFSLGLFALVVALSGLALRPAIVYATASLGALAQGALMREASVGWGPVAVAVVTLLMMAAMSHYKTRRLRLAAIALTRAEVDRALEARRFQEVEEARRTIERLLGEEHAKNAQLSALQRDKEQLTQFLVHDLRSPLSALTMTLSWMEQEVKSDSLLESVRTGLAITARLDRMITDMMDVPLLEEGRLEPRRAPLLASALLDEVRRSLEGVARARRIQLEVAAPERLELVGDLDLLVRVVENLTTNAVRYAATGGRVRLEGGEDATGRWLAVRNDGAPIPRELRGRIFDKYVQGEPERDSRRGYGLGLYFSRLAAEAHGGRLEVEDAPGWATSFVVRLPA
ncbi:HAMP domain-containing histidine kinase [Myxococcus stipitatus]|uniref:sensor histidine kinase n=1 Tax=Myxococcus stipitatus TaxID=83455 RepID=UPI001F2061A7|nr:HAMP domain-containing sensor histidine kinase [Myxococcus stipitatus]MCE9667463.1 HAMP domain-containing histidine kinase [Myxococcus stipitatus]